MSTVINFHNIEKTTVRKAVKVERDADHGGTFYSREITFTFQDGSRQSICLFSATAEAIEVNAKTELA